MSKASVIITGASRGLGAEFVKQYSALHPEYHLILPVRNPSALTSNSTPKNVSYITCEMVKLENVRSCTKEIIDKVNDGTFPPIEAMVHNAAIQITEPNQPRLTPDGYEETMAVNHLAHFIMLMDLIPIMKPDGKVLIIGSDSHMPDYKFFTKKALYKPLEALLNVVPGSEKGQDPVANGRERYGNSKLFQMMIGHELARRLKKSATKSGIQVVMVNPGSMGGTGLMRNQPWLEQKIFAFVMTWMPGVLNWIDPQFKMTSTKASAIIMTKALDDPAFYNAKAIDSQGEEVKEGGAPYFSPFGEHDYTSGAADDPGKCTELWEDTARLLGYQNTTL